MHYSFGVHDVSRRETESKNHQTPGSHLTDLGVMSTSRTGLLFFGGVHVGSGWFPGARGSAFRLGLAARPGLRAAASPGARAARCPGVRIGDRFASASRRDLALRPGVRGEAVFLLKTKGTSQSFRGEQLVYTT